MLPLQPVSEVTAKFIDNIERLVQQVPRTKKRALILFFRKDEQVVGVELRDISVYTKKSLILAQDER